VRDVAARLLELVDKGERGALATVVRTSGSVPQVAGARLLVGQDGQTVGTVGGGAIEKAVLEALEGCLGGGPARLLSWDLVRDLGMCCGGRMEVFVEPIVPPLRLFVFGAGHVARPTCQLVRTLGFAVTVIDDRAELNTEERFPGCQRVLAEPAEAAPGLGLCAEDWALILTRAHRLDEEALEVCAYGPHRYIGLMGSRRKIVRVIERLGQRRGLPALDRVYAPVGLDVGAVTPGEIAVSIAAELVAVRRGRPSAHLSLATGSLLGHVAAASR
jgi:xanthine dehydrogenase accessory factor